MTDKIPEALAVLDNAIAEIEHNCGKDSCVQERKARAAFAELIEASHNILNNVENGGCCPNVVSEKAQDVLYKALAAVENLK